jgi:hypothetical protein
MHAFEKWPSKNSRRWEVRMSIRIVVCEDERWVELAQDRGKWWNMESDIYVEP